MLKSHTDFYCRIGAVVWAVCWLASCSTVPKPVAVNVSDHVQALWGEHQQQLMHYPQWSAKGRAALRSESDSWSATLTWQQDNTSYHVRLAGPFGQGAVTIDGNDGSVSVHIAGQQAVVTNDAESLLSQHLGWTVPVSSLPYWLRGLPAPGQVEAIALNESGVLDQLKQQGWQIDYSAYRPLRGVKLPRKIQIKNDSLRLKLVLDRWSLGEKQ